MYKKFFYKQSLTSGTNRLNIDYQAVLSQIKVSSKKKPKLIMAPREFTEITGNIESAIILSQLLYWQDKVIDGEMWIYKSYKDWYIETGLSERQIKKARNTLEKMGFLETKIKKARGVPTLHYRLDVVKLCSFIADYYRQIEKLTNPFI